MRINMDIVKELESDIINGIDEEEAGNRIKKFGYNELPQINKENIIITFLKQFCDPLIYILLFGGCTSLFLKEYSDGIFIFIILSINSLIGCIQEYSAQKSADSLKNMVKSKTVVIRNSFEKEIESKNLTIGDIVILKDGARVPADIVLLESENLEVNESMLTGESVAVKKNYKHIQKENCQLQEKFNEIFAGTIIVRGVAKGIVKSIGINTEMGKIADKITQKSDVETPLVIRMQAFSKMFTFLIGGAVVFIVLISLLRGDNIRNTFLMAVSLAVAAIPEGLPITITIALSIGMMKMAKRNVVVRNLSAVEALGSCTVIASDKTGTLTQNEMQVVSVFDTNGKNLDISKLDKLTDLSANNFNNLTPEEIGYLACILPNEANQHDGEFFGDAVDVAFLKYVINRGYDFKTILESFKRLKLLYYTSESRYSASFNEINGKIIAFVKGAPETILSLCKNNDKHKIIKDELENLSNDGMRVLAIGYGEIVKKEGDNYEASDLKGLNFLALVSMLDPLRVEVKSAIEECQNAGVKIVMITGDNAKTAFAISKQLGFVENMEEVKTGIDVKKALDVSQKELDVLTENTKVYSRMEPTQKLDIVQSLIRNGNFIAVTGDGVNDAPALKNANVGIAMGKGGTDIARESADIILMDDNFTSITNAVEEGRVVYNNIRKVIFFAVSCGIPKVLIYIITIVLGLPVPFNASQLLWLNVMTEGVQNIFLAFEGQEGDEMCKKPRNPEESIFNRVMIRRCVWSILTFTIVCTGLYYVLIKVLGYTHIKSTSLLLMMFVFMQNLQVLNSRSETKSIFRHSIKNNKKLIFGILCAVSIHLFATVNPVLHRVLKIDSLNLKEIGAMFILATVVVVVSEIEKRTRGDKVLKVF
jgi:Ca2+-transporting ATPase